LVVTSGGWHLPDGMAAMAPDPSRLGPALAALGARRVWLIGGPRTLALAHAAGLLRLLELHVVPVALGAGLPLGLPAALLTLEAATLLPLSVARLRWRVNPP
jgi:hypothetical protein